MSIDNISAGVQFQSAQYEAESQINDLTNRAEISGASLRELQELKQASQDFEAIFINMMLDSMRANIPESTLIPKNEGAKLFEDMMYKEYSKDLSETDHFGMARMIFDQTVQQLSSTRNYEGPSFDEIV